MPTETKPSEFSYWFVLIFLIFLPALFFALFWGLYQLTTTGTTIIHYLSGTVVSLAALGALLSFIEGSFYDATMTKAENLAMSSPKLKTGWLILSYSFSMSSVAVSVTLFSWISYLFIKFNVTSCELSAEPSYSILIQTYLWHMLDLLPFTNIEKTFGWQGPPIVCRGWVGALVLGFRFLTGIILLANLRTAWVKFKDSQTNEAQDAITKHNGKPNSRISS